MIYVGVDPAMANTGVAIYGDGDDHISTALIRATADVKNFENIYRAGVGTAHQIREMLSSLVEASGYEGVRVMMEYPPPMGGWAPGLYAVDSLVLYQIHSLEGVEVRLAHPTRIDTLLVGPEPANPVPGMQRKTKFSKTERKTWVNSLLESNGMYYVMAPREPKKPLKPLKSGKPRKPRAPTVLTPDEADATILLLYMIFNMTNRISLPEGLLRERWDLKETLCPRR